MIIKLTAPYKYEFKAKVFDRLSSIVSQKYGENDRVTLIGNKLVHNICYDSILIVEDNVFIIEFKSSPNPDCCAIVNKHDAPWLYLADESEVHFSRHASSPFYELQSKANYLYGALKRLGVQTINRIVLFDAESTRLLADTLPFWFRISGYGEIVDAVEGMCRHNLFLNLDHGSLIESLYPANIQAKHRQAAPVPEASESNEAGPQPPKPWYKMILSFFNSRA